ncbi:MAG TPA: small ribosomal subunit Rsm22 family protein [Kiritimatiellia bacterium]|nr:small ribosomal subunit Rsm22 family protein [Kiritimatiellia bacterium]
MPSKPGYPEALEAAWLRHALRITRAGQPRLAVERLEKAAGSLSDAFTTGRDPSFAGYSHDRRALAAYGLFFFPRAYARTQCVMDEVRPHIREPEGEQPMRLLDLGAGTGAAGLAVAHVLSEWFPERPLHLEMIDQAEAGLERARELFAAGRALWPRATLRDQRADARTHENERPFDIIIASFAVNEWMENQPDEALLEWVRRQWNALRPGGCLIIIEPALRFTVARMERLRDAWAASSVGRIIAPCPHHQACPMLAQKRGWCHEVREWDVPASLRMINRRLHRDVHLLKYSMLVLQKTGRADEGSPWMRLVSPVAREKGKYVVHGCAADGNLHRCEWLTRHLTPEQKTFTETLRRGNRVHMPAGERLGDGRTERLAGPPELISHEHP